MISIFNRYLWILAVVMFVFIVCDSENAKSEDTIPAYEEFRHVKRVKIIVEQSYDEAKKVSLPFKKVATTLFKYASVQVVPKGSIEYDAILTIKAIGEAIGAEYRDDAGGRYYLYDGASLEGTILFEVPGIHMLEEEFNGTKAPSIVASKNRPPADAPFRLAFNEKGSFTPKIAMIIGRIFGVNTLISALRDKDSDVRMGAINALDELEEIRDIQLVEPLILALKDKDRDVRMKAADALGEIKDIRALKPLILAIGDKDASVRISAVESLVKIGEPAVKLLIIALKHKDSGVRIEAATALGGIGDLRALEPLIKALRDKDWIVREYAAWALGALKDVRAVEPLIKALGDEVEVVRENAAEALRKITEKDFNQDRNKWQEWWEKNKTKQENVRNDR